MDIPQLPTDNLYKFKAFVGVVISLGIFWFTLIKLTEINYQTIDIRTQVEKERIQLDDINYDIADIKSGNNKSTEALQLLKQKLINVQEKNEDLKGNMEKLKYNKRDFWLFAFIGTSGVLYGILLAIIGFHEWNTLVQTPQDSLLRMQVELIQKQIESMNSPKSS